jgi:hypothetical protein
LRGIAAARRCLIVQLRLTISDANRRNGEQP